MEKLAEQISEYVRDYQVRHSIGRKEMAKLLGLSVTSISRIEENSEGLAIKYLVLIAGLEFSTVSDFFKAIEKGGEIPTGLETRDKRINRLIQTVDDEEIEEFLTKTDAVDPEKAIGHRFAWTIRLMNLILSGTSSQLAEMEISALNFYLNNIDEKSKKARSRFTSLIRYRFKF